MVNRFPYSEGSTWRKWDLHLHGPEDVLNNRFAGSDLDDKWNKFVDRLNSTELEGVALTNYFCIDGYERLRNLQRTGKLKHIRCVLPSIEFRLAVNNKEDDPINVHVIFSDKLEVVEIQNFLARLELVNTDSSRKTLYCDRDTVQSVGLEKAVISEPALRKSLDASFKKGDEYLVAVACNGYGSIRPAQGRQHVVTDELDKWACFFFGKDANREFFLRTDRYIDAVAKAVACGSDAHSLDEIDTAGSWIKADPTFEGLRQIIFEPHDRISLTKTKPDSRPDYTIINRVRFADNTGKTLFASDYIKINPKLTTIIGGKSTGKSLMMQYAAMTIDPGEVTKRLNVAGRDPYTVHSEPDFDFEVEWKDGFVQRLKQKRTQDNDPRRIVYIPQAFLNRLSESDKGSQDTLNEFVLSVLLQDQGAESTYKRHHENIRQVESEINAVAERTFGLRRQEDEIKEQIKNLGDLTGIRKYISDLQVDVERLRAQSGLSPDDARLLEEKSKEDGELRKSKKAIENDTVVLRQLKQKTTASLRQATDHVESSLGFASLPETQVAFARYKAIVSKCIADLDSVDSDLTRTLTAKSESVSVAIKAIEDILKPLNDRLKLSEEVKKKDDTRKSEEEKASKIELLQKQLTSCREQIVTCVDLLKVHVESILESYKQVQADFKKYESRLIDIALNIYVHLDESSFVTSCIDDNLNKTDLKRELGILESDGSYLFRQDGHASNQFRIIEALVTGSIKTVKKKTLAEAILSVAKDRYTLDFKISYKDDPLSKMSPGKKGLTLLRLLIELSERDWPILIDQPEDDLDNRSVYADLVAFLRRKKNERQIITVTHNPNLVVGADAELIIVANQDGQDLGRDNKMHRFEYVAGAIENCFAAPDAQGILNQMGIREHVCDILEGGVEAFKKREAKYQKRI